jgi:hypothetical protein
MAGMTDYSATNWLNYITGKAAMPALGSGNVYLGLFTTAPTSDSGITGAVEVSGTSYARQQTTATSWNAAANSTGAEPAVTPAQISNAQPVTFPVAGSAWGDVLAIGLFDALTAGNLLFWDYLGAYNWLPFYCSLASPGVFDIKAHGFSNGDLAVLTAKFGGTLPGQAGSWAGPQTVAGVTTDTFDLGVNTTTTGDGMIRRILKQNVQQGVQVSFAANTLLVNAG